MVFAGVFLPEIFFMKLPKDLYFDLTFQISTLMGGVGITA